MLDGLTVAVALTALLAGLTGAFSPCGFSMVDTIGSALGDIRRSITLLACLTFTIGAVLGGVLTFGGLALVGRLVGNQSSSLGTALGALIALTAAIADWRGVRIAPQIRRQVPERWRWQLPLPLACGLYGVLLGLGFTTFVLSFAVWALAGVSVALGSLPVGLVVGLAFGIGRALPVVWMAPGLRGGNGATRLEAMAAEPRLWLGLRRLDALGLLLCALLMSGTVANAFSVPAATDPSTSGGLLAWQMIGGPGVLRLPSGQQTSLPGTFPALGESVVAWQSNGQITVANLATLTPKLTLPAINVNALAVSDSWVVYRNQSGQGDDNLIAVSLANPVMRRYVAGPRPPGQLGRPALDGATVVFTIDTQRATAITSVNLATDQRQTLRSSNQGVALANPSLLDGKLLYERTDRCAQELRLGSVSNRRHDRVLLSLSSTVQRDPGYEPGYEANWNAASLCPNRPAGLGGRKRLGPAALSPSVAYVSETSGAGQSRIVSVSH